MAITWTNEQKRAIETLSGNGNILVSAAAGSGKTAVLVERIISRLTDEKSDLSIDELLVVTFTDAAASEMREKIIKELYKKLRESKGNEYKRLKRQIRLAGNADIVTIDSFCMRVLKNNFYILGVDPNFRIADSAEGELMAADAMDSLFDRLYDDSADDTEKKKFEHLLNIYADNRSDDGLKELVYNIYKFTRSFADPDKWLDEKAAMYSGNMSESAWVRRYLPEVYIKGIGKKYARTLSELISDMALEASGIKPNDVGDDNVRRMTVEACGDIAAGAYTLLAAADELKNARCWDDANRTYRTYIADGSVIDNLTARNKPKNIEISYETWKVLCKRRNDIKKAFFAECEPFKLNEAELVKLFHGDGLKNQLDELVWLVKEFEKEYSHKKELRNIKEFGDVEHLVYKLFSVYEDIRRVYREKYKEILIDEYQDTNGLQDSIFESISRDGKNIFMVGDLKQSIYRFRGGDPMIFKEKSGRYIRDDNDGIKIELSENFRSGQEILKSVNSVFDRIMTENLGDVNYEGKERIRRESDKDAWDDKYKSELHFTAFTASDEENEELSAARVEAEFTAQKIYKLKQSGFLIHDRDTMRPVEYSDIAVLMRSVKSEIGKEFLDALKRRGILGYIEAEDYFKRREIQLMLSVLSVIDNCRQDIPLTAVARSPIGGFSDNDLARVRIASPKGGLYDAIKAYSQSDAESAELSTAIKCRKLIGNINRWHDYVKRKSVANLIWSIYEETGLYDFMGAFEDGEQSRANLRLLYQRAEQFEKTGFKGLFNFIKYIERIKSRKNDLSNANISGGSDTVRIMTIHKSKGLEFPVVFLAGMGKKFVSGRGKSDVIWHNSLGFGIRYANADKGYFEDNIIHSCVAEQNKIEELSENMRLLYVAMTRAKDKLIAVVSKKIKETEKKDFDTLVNEQLAKWRSGAAPESASGYAEWLCPAALNNPDSWSFSKHRFVLETEKSEADGDNAEEIEISDELREAVNKNFSYRYKYERSGYIPAKTSVSALKRFEKMYSTENSDRKYEYDPIYMSAMPEFMREKKLGTEIGTAHHQLMAFINLDGLKSLAPDKYEEYVNKELLRIVSDGQIDAYYAEDNITHTDIVRHTAEFFKSGLGKNMLSADEVYREQPFQIEIGADVYDGSLGKEYADEGVILQGIIDCFFIKDGSLTLLDYKTDRCQNDADAAALGENYRIQLELYKQAIEKITGKAVDKMYLYLFAIGRELEI